MASRPRAIERAIGRLVAAALLAAWPLTQVTANELGGHGGPVRALAITADGTIASGGLDTSLLVRATAGDRIPRRLQLHEQAIAAIVTLGAGKLAVSVGDDGRANLLDLGAAVPLRRFTLGAKLTAVAASPSGDLVAIGSFAEAIHLADPLSDAVPRMLDHRGERPTALRFLAAHDLLAAGHLGGLRRYDTRTGELHGQRAGPGQAISDLATLADGRVAASGLDGKIQIVDPATLERNEEVLEHDRPLLALAASADGKRLAAGDPAGNIILWNLPQRQPIRLIRAHRGPVWDLAFAPGSGELVSAGADGMLRIWGQDGTGPELAAAGKAPSAAAGQGERLYRKCVACHTVTPDGGNRAGPTLLGLFGRPAGKVEGYAYSQALAASGIVWGQDTIGRLFEIGPDQLLPGTKMPIQRIADPVERAALLDYLQTITSPTTDAPPAGEQGTRP